MFTIIVETTFNASHQLTDSKGKVEPLHSHDWVVAAAVSVAKLDKTGIAIDFLELKVKVEKITSVFSGARLEHLPAFAGLSTSAENVAKYIYVQLQPSLPPQARLKYIQVQEQPGCFAQYSK